DRLLDRHRHAEQWRPFAAGAALVTVVCLLSRAVEVANHDRVDRAVACLDSRDRRLARIPGTQATLADRLRQLARAAVLGVERGGISRLLCHAVPFGAS